MAYVNTPLAGQKVKNTRAPIQQNFIEINNIIDVDHYSFGVVQAGEHKKITLPDQGVPAVFPAGDVGLWAQIPTPAIPAVPLTGVNELYIRRQDGSQTNITGKGVAGNNIWSYLPSGLLIKIGFANPGAGFQTVVYPAAAGIPVFQSVLFTILQPVTGLGIDPNEYPVLLTTGYLPVSFDVFCGARTAAGIPINCTFTYMTIGT